jgi:chromosome segregation ATPase
MTTPPLPDELDDETLKSIQHRLHKGQAAQAEAEEAKKHAATLLVERDILQVETETLKTENTILKTKITTAQEAFDRQRAESTAAELDKNTKLTAEVLDLKTSLEKERNATKIEAEAAQKEVNALTTQNNDLMSAKNALSKQVTALTTEKRELDNRVATLTIENNALGTENATLKGQVDKLEQEVKSAIRNLEVYKMRVRAIANEP